jgi:hypothetical protein
MIDYTSKKHVREGEAKLFCRLTEFNVNTSNPNRGILVISNISFFGGQFSIEIYEIVMEYGAFAINPCCISKTDQHSTDFGFHSLTIDFLNRIVYCQTQSTVLNMKGHFSPLKVIIYTFITLLPEVMMKYV